MPNYCHNKLTVFGTNSMLQAFVNRGWAEDSPLSFENFVAMHQEDKEDWEEWRIKNWGNKWNATNCDVYSLSQNCIEYRFDTAWRPPIEWLRALVMQYPDISFILEFEEPKSRSAGRIVVQKGEEDEVNSFYVKMRGALPSYLEQIYEYMDMEASHAY